MTSYIFGSRESKLSSFHLEFSFNSIRFICLLFYCLLTFGFLWHKFCFKKIHWSDNSLLLVKSSNEKNFWLRPPIINLNGFPSSQIKETFKPVNWRAQIDTQSTRNTYVIHHLILLTNIATYSRVPNITVGLNKSVGANFSWKLIKK